MRDQCLIAALLLPQYLGLQIPFLTSRRDREFSLSSGIHLGAHSHPNLVARRSFDQPVSTLAFDYPHQSLRLKSKKRRVYRPKEGLDYHAARQATWQQQGHEMQWDEVDIDGPDITDVVTLANLAKMSSNAYTTPSDGWYDLGNNYNLSSSFGWAEDGLRGHVFATPDNSSVVVAVKGTSAFSGGIGGPTGRNDKFNDNLLFSCCCARVDWSWSTVCDCYKKAWTCGQTCVEDALMEKSVYYPLTINLYNNITALYPNANIWLTGHSLGGALAALMSITFGVPCVTFEAPGDYMAAKRLHLPVPAGKSLRDISPVTHVYTNSDPIPQGVCTGPLSACSIAGFALEAKCHTGKSIVYDAVGKLGWSVDIRTHRVGVIIDKLLIPDWDKPASFTPPKKSSWWKLPLPGRSRNDSQTEPEEPDEEYGKVPEAVSDEECEDCFRWNFTDAQDQDEGGTNLTTSKCS